MLQGIKLDPKNPLHLDFIINTGKAIPNNYVEQNLYEHFKTWAEALRAEGQKDFIDIELHTIPPESEGQT